MAYTSTRRLRGYTKKNKGILTRRHRDPSCPFATQPTPASFNFVKKTK